MLPRRVSPWARPLAGQRLRGSGYVRWQFEENRGFLRATRPRPDRGRIGEDDEAERCAHFLMQCDPTGVSRPGAEADMRGPISNLGR